MSMYGRLLTEMVGDLKTIRVEELHHGDWLAVLRQLSSLIRDIDRLANDDPVAQEILLDAVRRARRDRLPIAPDERDRIPKGTRT